MELRLAFRSWRELSRVAAWSLWESLPPKSLESVSLLW
jgi:hypothetical protein